MILIIRKKKVRKIIKEMWLSNFNLVYGDKGYSFGEKVAELCCMLGIYDQRPPSEWEDE